MSVPHMILQFIAFGVVLVALLVALAIYDSRHMILPDWLNSLLGAAGLVQAFAHQQPEPVDGAIAAVMAGGLLLAIAAAYKYARGTDGLGLGDVKLAAAGAVWTGVAGIGPMLLAASASCGAVILSRAALGARIDARARFPFGPYLAFGVFAAWILTHWRLWV